MVPFTHLFLTSDDINNVAYRLLIKNFLKRQLLPTLKSLVEKLDMLSRKHKDFPILARTHGQAAVPTTFGKEVSIFK
jgi:adenylosuccinate lyase